MERSTDILFTIKGSLTNTRSKILSEWALKQPDIDCSQTMHHTHWYIRLLVDIFHFPIQLLEG